MNTVHLQQAFVLHRRAYRETSFLVDLFTPDFGRLTVIAKGVRKKASCSPALLQPFVSLLVSWYGKGELMTLTHVEAIKPPVLLQSECLFAGFYLNELLTYLLQKWDAHPVLFTWYAKTVIALQSGKLEQKILRVFEKNLLQELGYGLLTKEHSLQGERFLPDKYYRFTMEQGFVLSGPSLNVESQSNIFSGKSLLAIAAEDWQVAESLKDAKRLSRMVLMSLLGNRTLHSRQLFSMPYEEKRDE